MTGAAMRSASMKSRRLGFEGFMSNGSGLSRTYELHPNPPSAMSWEEYEQRVVTEWTSLLASKEGSSNERCVHDFLERHPSMIPGAYSMTGPSGHSPFPLAVLSESPLCGVGMRIPDFIWLASDSANFTPVFIEIESPCKRWFTEQQVPTHDLVQALNQLAQWRAWLNRPENVAVFYESFEIPEWMRRHHTFRPEFVLIYGRRKEFDDRPELRRLREQFERHGQVVMTFDRLRPAQDCRLYLSATKRNGAYRALAVPATIAIGPNVAKEFAQIAGLPEAIQKNEWISEDRRRFLVERLPYWKAWAEARNRGIINSGDWE
jgi:hypothetical protein